MDFDQVEDILLFLGDEIEHRINKYKRNCLAKTNLKEFYEILEELKMPIQSESYDECKAVLKHTFYKIHLRKAKWESTEEYNEFKEIIETKWQTIQLFLLQ